MSTQPNTMAEFQPWFLQLFSLLSNVSVSIAAIIAILGIWKWRRELIGTKKFDIARKMTILAIKFRDDLVFTRTPVTFEGETADRDQSPNETLIERTLKNEYHARNKRLRVAQATLRELQELSWEAEVILTEEDSKLIDSLLDVYKELGNAIDTYFFEQINFGVDDPEYIKENIERLNKMKASIYNFGDDEIERTVNRSVKKFKQQLRKYVT